jgi:type II secretory pathway component GspD/PulD (secretin)
LGEIPGLRYLFAQDNKEVNDQEVLVMLTPRVIRLPEPSNAEGSPVPVGAPGGGAGGAEDRPGFIDTPRPLEPQP